MEFSDYVFVALTEDTEIKPFDCGDDDLNSFLFDDSKNYLKELLAVTYLLVDSKEEKTIAYFSLLNDKISIIPEDKSRWNKISRNIKNAKRRRHYPAVKIGRFAISKEYHGKGIGTFIINFLKYAFSHGNRTGCRFITVDAYASAVGFYQSKQCNFDFFTNSDCNDFTRLMLFDLKPFKDAANRIKAQQYEKTVLTM